MSRETRRLEALRRIQQRSLSLELPDLPPSLGGSLEEEKATQLIVQLRRVTGPNQSIPIVIRENVEDLLESNLFGYRVCDINESVDGHKLRPYCIASEIETGKILIVGYTLFGCKVLDLDTGEWRRLELGRLQSLVYSNVYEVTPLLPIESLSLMQLLGYTFHIIRGDFVWILGLSIISILLLLTSPILTSRIVQDVVPSGSLRYIASASVLSLLIAFYSAFFHWFKGFFQVRLSMRLGYQSSLALYARVLQLPVWVTEQNSVGDLVSRVSSFSGMLSHISSQSLNGIISSLSLFGYLALMFIYDIQLAFFSLALVICFVIAQLYFSWRLVRFKAKSVELNADLYDSTVQTLSMAAQVRSTGTEPFFLDRWTRRKTLVTANAFRSAANHDWMTLLSSSVISCGYILFYGVIIYRMFNSSSLDMLAQTTGRFIVFTSAYGGFAIQAQALSMLVADTISSVIVDFNRAKLLLQQKPETGLEFDRMRIKLNGDIKFKNITFSYPEAQAPALERVNFALKPGHFNVLFGPSGCGKSTLLSLILGFYQADSGSIVIDGVPLHKLDIKHFRSQIGAVLQSPTLPPGSIADAVSAGLSVPQDQIWEALAMANVAEEVSALPMKLETVLSEGATNISGGQRQRICIARALLNQPSLLLEDEATSALDASSQKCIAANLRQQSVTRVVVAHRLSAIQHCDHMVVINNGSVEWEGTFEECCANSPYVQSVMAAAVSAEATGRGS